MISVIHMYLPDVMKGRQDFCHVQIVSLLEADTIPVQR